MRPRTRIVGITLMAALGLVPATLAHAAFPGGNGDIAFGRSGPGTGRHLGGLSRRHRHDATHRHAEPGRVDARLERRRDAARLRAVRRRQARQLRHLHDGRRRHRRHAPDVHTRRAGDVANLVTRRLADRVHLQRRGQLPGHLGDGRRRDEPDPADADHGLRCVPRMVARRCAHRVHERPRRARRHLGDRRPTARTPCASRPVRRSTSVPTGRPTARGSRSPGTATSG